MHSDRKHIYYNKDAICICMNNHNKRQYRRVPINLDANYVINNSCNGHSKIIDISPDGMALHIHLTSTIKINVLLSLMIIFPKKNDKIPASVNLKWIKELDNNNNFNFIAGCKFTKIDTEVKRGLLEFAYDNWFRTV